MISIQPVDLPPRQPLHVNQLPTIWYHGDMLEAQVWFVAKLMLRFDFFYQDHVFNSDAKLAILVVSWLVGEDIAWR